MSEIWDVPVIVTDRPLVAHRVWAVSPKGVLQSMNGVEWPTREPLLAICNCQVDDERNNVVMHHGCGIYSVKERELLFNFHYLESPVTVYGELWIWGEMLKYSEGYRSKYAYPKNIILAHQPHMVKGLMDWVEGLTKYYVDIYLAFEGVESLLWSPDHGYIEQGLQLILDTKSKWYKRRSLLTTAMLAVGDRVFIGSELALVQSLDSDNQNVILTASRHNYHGPRLSVIWDAKHRLWRANKIAFSTRSK